MRTEIHSSLVSTIFERSSLERTRFGTAEPQPISLEPLPTILRGRCGGAERPARSSIASVVEHLTGKRLLLQRAALREQKSSSDSLKGRGLEQEVEEEEEGEQSAIEEAWKCADEEEEEEEGTHAIAIAEELASITRSSVVFL